VPKNKHETVKITVNPTNINFTSICLSSCTKDVFILIERSAQLSRITKIFYYVWVDWAMGKITTISQIVELFASPVYLSGNEEISDRTFLPHALVAEAQKKRVNLGFSHNSPTDVPPERLYHSS